MITVQKYAALGEMQIVWLHAHYHFSFANYYNPARTGLGKLRVLNDDRVRAGKGFSPHPHRDMEIITYVREGAIVHRDNLGNQGITKAGDVQVMSAGTGIVHSEMSAPESDTTLFQIWIEPDELGVTPRWEAAQFPRAFAQDALPLLVSGRARDKDSGALYIHSDAAVYGGRLQKGAQITQKISDTAYLVLSQGSVDMNGQPVTKGDGAEIVGETQLTLRASEDSELLLIDVGQA